MKPAEGVTEELKASDPLAWAQQMNNIHARAKEIVLHELIFTGIAPAGALTSEQGPFFAIICRSSENRGLQFQ